MVWVVRKRMETHWVLAETQRKQTLVAAVAVIAAAMPVVRAGCQMPEALTVIRVAVVLDTLHIAAVQAVA